MSEAINAKHHFFTQKRLAEWIKQSEMMDLQEIIKNFDEMLEGLINTGAEVPPGLLNRLELLRRAAGIAMEVKQISAQLRKSLDITFTCRECKRSDKDVEWWAEPTLCGNCNVQEGP